MHKFVNIIPYGATAKMMHNFYLTFACLEIKKMTAEITVNADEIRMLIQRSGSSAAADQTSNISNVSFYMTTVFSFIYIKSEFSDKN